ncbi:glucan 1,3-beta-glucosidase [Cryptococcus wingfieldii CBS 7118]|uniref:glucan 1,3-beta-glucosidase n=1 Tax=Cryptococcus wingfieldii CBS 7118 TaxID=1295528 RepID=A0A1E3I158_9TREE|nr:glucan 1,3-beta-glucosidase [Cryptococcus wingfieldii CBS 7118]ODN82333.1 glucan 1,3-beta-glucosidase [Cryptococcus wingfieldii CBS 7118]
MLLLTTLLALPLVVNALPAPAASPAVEKRSVNLGWDYGQEKVRGVNIGGWLVLEPFITPSIFESTGNEGIIDEYTFCQYQDYDTAQSALQNHWNTWFTEDDFAKIAGAGLNHVRIPIGYWAYDVQGDEPYIQGAADYLDKAIGWAGNHGLKVLVDLHGVPGSQNGYDNSGQRGDALWATDSNNVERAKNVIATLATKYSDPQYYGVVTAIALLNEPATYLNDELLSTTRQYWYDAYGVARYPFGNSDKSGLAIVIHDGFQDPSTYNNYMTEPEYEDVILDTHNYQVFNDEYMTWNWDQHIAGVCDMASTYSAADLWLIVGEWSLASTDCAKYLNGRGIGARYDGSYSGSSYVGDCSDKSNDASQYSSEYKAFMRKYWDVQTQLYEANGQGWIHWTWKTEDASDWGYEAGIDGGWIPADAWYHDSPLSSYCG